MHGRALLITGATGAIGSEIAAVAAAAGATVGVHGSRPESVEAAMVRLQARAPDATLIATPGDFSKPDGVDNAVAQFARDAGRIDGVIHCAIMGAPGVGGVFADTKPQHYADHAARVLATFQRLSYATLPHLARQGGAIVGFASDAGRFAAPRQAIIGAAFGGIITFVRNLGLEIGRDGVRVNCISLTFVEDTPSATYALARTEAARKRASLGLPTPKDIAPMAVFLCGPGAEKITGQVISINGGLNA